MDPEKMKRISFLSQKSRREPLTEEEKAEQKQLREEYIAAFRGNLKRQLDNIEIIRPDGSRQTLTPKKKS